MLLSEKILREYVRNCLLEYSDVDAMTGMDSSVGGHEGVLGDFFNIVSGPIKDVFKTAATETKVLSRRVMGTIRAVLEMIISALIPGFEANYAPIFQRQKDDIAKIRASNKEVEDRTWAALKSNEAGMFAFMFAPAAFMTGKIAKSAPAVTKGILSTFTGGISDQVIEKSVKKLKEKYIDAKVTALGGTEKDKKKARASLRNSGSSGGYRFSIEDIERELRGESFSRLVREEKEDSKNDNKKIDNKILAVAIEEALKDPEIIALINKNNEKTRKAATETLKKTLNDAYKSALLIAKGMKSVQEVEALLQKSKDPSAAKAKEQLAQIKKMPPEQQKAALETMSKALKVSGKAAAIAPIKKMIDDAIAAGADESNPLVKASKEAIKKIEQLFN